jgi:GNAT superfamily N-acetyltransferase
MIVFYCYEDYFEISKTDKVISLVCTHMRSIGSNLSKKQVNERLKDSLSKDNQSLIYVGYTEEDNPICFAYGNQARGIETKQYFWLNEIHVDATMRKQGVGSKLLAFIEEDLAKRGVQYMASMTLPSNFSSQQFFSKNNYGVEKCMWIDKKLIK